MSLSNIAKEFIAAVEDIAVTNGDGVADTLLCRLYNNQPERRAAATGYDYKTPALFFEFLFDEHEQLGLGVTGKGMRIRCLLEVTKYNTEGELDQDLTILDLKETIHRKLNGMSLPQCSPLIQSSEILDSNHDNTYLYSFEYSTFLFDLTGSPYDELNTLYTEQTLTNPVLVLGDNITNAITETTTDYVNDVVEYITGVTISAESSTLSVTLTGYEFIYLVGDELPSFYIDWGDGSLELIEKNTLITHDYSVKGLVIPSIVGLFGAQYVFSIYINPVNEIIEYPTLLSESVAYDVDNNLDHDYPIGITFSHTFGTSTFRNITLVNDDTSQVLQYESTSKSSYQFISDLAFPSNTLSISLNYRGNTYTETHLITNTHIINLTN